MLPADDAAVGTIDIEHSLDFKGYVHGSFHHYQLAPFISQIAKLQDFILIFDTHTVSPCIWYSGRQPRNSNDDTLIKN